MPSTEPITGGRRIGLPARLVLVGLIGACGVLVWMYQRTPASPAVVVEEQAPPPEAAPTSPPEPAPSPTSTLEERWGIQVSSITLTNSDTAVALRYTVIAPEKTALLAQANAEVYLIDQASGTKIPMFAATPEETASSGVPRRTVRRMMRFAGAFPPAPSRLIAGKAYYLQIPNWDKTLRRGSRVSFVIGDLRQDDLTVE